MEKSLPVLSEHLLASRHARSSVVPGPVGDTDLTAAKKRGRPHTTLRIVWTAKGTRLYLLDVVPTFLEAFNLPGPDILDGRSFLSVLLGLTNRHKDHVFGQETARGIIAGPEYCGIRSVRDQRSRSILNLPPQATFQNGPVRHEPFLSWKQAGEHGNQSAVMRVHEFQHRPAEELYNCAMGPWNRPNLIAEPKFAQVKAELRDQFDAWMKQPGDEGQATEMKALERIPGRRNRADANGEGE